MPQAPEHELLARQVGVPHLVVFLNKCDVVNDPELIDQVEMDLRELLTRFGFPGDEVPYFCGSAMLAHDNPTDSVAARCIDELLAALDRYIPGPVRDVDKPLLPICSRIDAVG